MKIIFLSNHVNEHLKARQEERQRKYAKEVETYKEKLAAQKMAVEAIKEKRATAWQRGKLWQALKYCIQLYVPNYEAVPVAPVMTSADAEDRKWEAGKQGERRVHDHLQSKLDDSWIMLAGYRNSRGEVDVILVGPDGLFGMEIKHINGRINCDADQWSKDKYDNYGILVDWGTPIADSKGRSPSLQLNEPLALLESVLKRQFQNLRFHRLVIFTHDNSRLGTLLNTTVDDVVVLEKWKVPEMLKKNNHKLSRRDVQAIVKRIEQDHQRNSNRGRNGKIR